MCYCYSLSPSFSLSLSAFTYYSSSFSSSFSCSSSFSSFSSFFSFSPQEEAMRTVEGVHSEWKFNDWLDIRSVHSGYWDYCESKK